MDTWLKKCICFLFMSAYIAACSSSQYHNEDEIIVNDLNNQQVHLNLSDDVNLNVFFFLSPECPFCINYTKTISEIINNKSYSDISFHAVYPGTYYSNEEIRQFHKDYNFVIDVLIDPEMSLTHRLEATVTPQVIIVDHSGKTVYTGAIDNWAVDTGVKRQVISEHYLSDALQSALIGKTPKVSKTKPVGCYIEL